jgi:hypothetical protein
MSERLRKTILIDDALASGRLVGSGAVCGRRCGRLSLPPDRCTSRWNEKGRRHQLSRMVRCSPKAKVVCSNHAGRASEINCLAKIRLAFHRALASTYLAAVRVSRPACRAPKGCACASPRFNATPDSVACEAHRGGAGALARALLHPVPCGGRQRWPLA